MSTYIKGQNQTLAIWNGTDAYEPLICIETSGFNETVDEISGRTNCDIDGTMQKQAGAYSYEIPFSGLFPIPETDKVSWAELRTKLRALENVDWRLTTSYPAVGTNPSSDDVEYGNGYFSSLEKEATTDEFITFSGSLVGSGKPSATDPNV